ncbi:XdhC family protein [Piscinibacter sp. XHJ-5]|uniref:XdhC family protein n=1 Tax=Piscinibacter sp. XHJ-5 TaxID=3037797 RepID=UPI00245303B4|nr:XdhC family protein [Piscinibacter sp. XHJ-5]
MDAVDVDVLSRCASWLALGREAALLTVVRTWGSSPRPAGAMMAIRDDGLVAGSVSGGCIEDDLIAKVRDAGIKAVAPGGKPCLVTYGVRAEEAHRFGLPCGGTLQLALEPLGSHSRIEELVQRLERRVLTLRTLHLDSGAVDLGDASCVDELHCDEQTLRSVLGARFRLLVIGAGQLSRYLCQIAVGLGFDVTVCDPRDEYAETFDPEGVQLVRCMPDDAVQAMALDERSAVIALTHDPKLDDLALMDALETPAFYVGALGSRANNASRRERLKTHFGMTDEQLARLRGPAGLYIGSRTPPEIALSILAEIVAAKNGVAMPRLLGVGEAKDAFAARPAENACFA